MPIIYIHGKQLLHFIEVYADAVLPMWRILRIPKYFHAKLINVVLVGMIFLFIIPKIDSLSPFPPSNTQYYDTTGKLIDKSQGINLFKVYLKLVVCSALFLMIIIAFLIDLKDAVSEEPLDRFVYHDESYDDHKRIWWTITILLLGYMVRIWFFGVIALIGIESSHISSVLKAGVSVINESSSIAGASDLGSKVFNSLQNPIGPWGEKVGGTVDSTVFILILNITRIIIFTFMVSVFYLLVSKSTSSTSIKNEVKRN